VTEIIAGSRSSSGKTYDPGLSWTKIRERSTLPHLAPCC